MIDLAGPADNARLAEAHAALGLAQALSGSVAAGKAACADAYGIARTLNNQDLLSATQLALAETLLMSHDPSGALQNAIELQARSNAGKPDSLWRAQLLAARAAQALGDKGKASEYAAAAARTLANIEQGWGADSYTSYLQRPDIRRNNNQLKELLSTSTK